MPYRTFNYRLFSTVMLSMAAGIGGCGKKAEPLSPAVTAAEQRVDAYTRCLENTPVFQTSNLTKKHCAEVAKGDK